jgi:hypothetical protein
MNSTVKRWLGISIALVSVSSSAAAEWAAPTAPEPPLFAPFDAAKSWQLQTRAKHVTSVGLMNQETD